VELTRLTDLFCPSFAVFFTLYFWAKQGHKDKSNTSSSKKQLQQFPQAVLLSLAELRAPSCRCKGGSVCCHFAVYVFLQLAIG